jgi:hypothetical protein
MRRLRKTGAVDQDGNVVTIPRLPSVAGSNKPPGWNRWSDAEKVEHLLGMSLDRMHDYLSWPADGLDPCRLEAQTQAVRVIVMVAAKAGAEAARGANGSVFWPRWRGISGIATRHRIWYGENARAAGPGARIMGRSRKLQLILSLLQASPMRACGRPVLPGSSSKHVRYPRLH